MQAAKALTRVTSKSLLHLTKRTADVQRVDTIGQGVLQAQASGGCSSPGKTLSALRPGDGPLYLFGKRWLPHWNVGSI